MLNPETILHIQKQQKQNDINCRREAQRALTKYERSKIYYENRTHIRAQQKEYQQNNPDKMREIRDKRRDNVSNFTLIPTKAFPKEIKMEGHHLDYMFVIVMPKKNHLKCLAGHDSILHRQKCLPLLNMMYNLNFINEFI